MKGEKVIEAVAGAALVVFPEPATTAAGLLLIAHAFGALD